MLLNALSYLLGNSLILLLPELSSATLIYSLIALIIIFFLHLVIKKTKKVAASSAVSVDLSISPPLRGFSLQLRYYLNLMRELLRKASWQQIITRLLGLATIALLAFSWALISARKHHDNILPQVLEQKSIEVRGHIKSFPEIKENSKQFEFQVEEVLEIKNLAADNFYYLTKNKGLNLAKVRISWQTDLALKLGDKWQLTLKLKRPRGFANPGSFDAEKNYFQQRITAVGYVNKKFPAKLIASNFSEVTTGEATDSNSTTNLLAGGFGEVSAKVRQSLYDQMSEALAGKEFAGTVLALTLGLQKAVAKQHWEVFQQIGIAHLLAISGLHVGFISGLAYLLCSLLWRRMPTKFLQIPAPRIGACGAILSAYGYAVLAGLSISAERALIMVIVAMLGIILRRKITATLSFAWALILVLFLEPLVVLAASFWLSFGAVAVLLYAFKGRSSNADDEITKANKVNKTKETNESAKANKPDRTNKSKGKVKFSSNKLKWVLAWFRPQMVLFLGMLPLSAAYFGKVVLISPLANFVLVPYVSLLVVPLAMLGILIVPWLPELASWCWLSAAELLNFVWPMLIKLQQMPLANITLEKISFAKLLILIIGVVWFLAPKGFPGRLFGSFSLLVFLGANPQQLAVGEMQFAVLDVGQGLSSVITTKEHVLLYDAGPKFSKFSSAGELVVVPYLQAQGIKQLDKIVISHTDLDHVGGLNSITKSIMPDQILTPKPSELNYDQVAACRAGQRWVWDEIEFEFLHPEFPLAAEKNDQSCVLKVSAQGYSILLTGDIGAKVEQKLVAKDVENLASSQELTASNQLQADILLVPHHGSSGSSTWDFIRQVNPVHAAVSVGYLNRYGHPKPKIVARYQAYGTNLLDTMHAGAISFKFDNKSKKILADCYRIKQRRFWREK